MKFLIVMTRLLLFKEEIPSIIKPLEILLPDQLRSNPRQIPRNTEGGMRICQMRSKEEGVFGRKELLNLHHPVLLSLIGVGPAASVRVRAEAVSRCSGLVDAFFYKLTRILVTVFLGGVGMVLDCTRFESESRQGIP